MTSESFDDLNDPNRDQIANAAEDAPQDVSSTQAVPVPGEFPDREEAELVAEADAEMRPTSSEVTDEDLSTADLMDNDVPPEDLEHGNMGRHTYQADMAEPGEQDTIDSRIRQEEPEDE